MVFFLLKKSFTVKRNHAQTWFFQSIHRNKRLGKSIQRLVYKSKKNKTNPFKVTLSFTLKLVHFKSTNFRSDMDIALITCLIHVLV